MKKIDLIYGEKKDYFRFVFDETETTKEIHRSKLKDIVIAIENQLSGF